MTVWRFKGGRVRIPSLFKKNIDDDAQCAEAVADFVRAWSSARHYSRATGPRRESEPRRLIHGDQWRGVLALAAADADAMSDVVLAAVRWAFNEGYRSGRRSGARRRGAR